MLTLLILAVSLQAITFLAVVLRRPPTARASPAATPVPRSVTDLYTAAGHEAQRLIAAAQALHGAAQRDRIESAAQLMSATRYAEVRQGRSEQAAAEARACLAEARALLLTVEGTHRLTVPTLAPVHRDETDEANEQNATSVYQRDALPPSASGPAVRGPLPTLPSARAGQDDA